MLYYVSKYLNVTERKYLYYTDQVKFITTYLKWMLSRVLGNPIVYFLVVFFSFSFRWLFYSLLSLLKLLVFSISSLFLAEDSVQMRSTSTLIVKSGYVYNTVFALPCSSQRWIALASACGLHFIWVLDHSFLLICWSSLSLHYLISNLHQFFLLYCSIPISKTMILTICLNFVIFNLKLVLSRFNVIQKHMTCSSSFPCLFFFLESFTCLFEGRVLVWWELGVQVGLRLGRGLAINDWLSKWLKQLGLGQVEDRSLELHSCLSCRRQGSIYWGHVLLFSQAY